MLPRRLQRISLGCNHLKWHSSRRKSVATQSIIKTERDKHDVKDQICDAQGLFSGTKIGRFFQDPPSLENQYLGDSALKSYLRRHMPKDVSDECTVGVSRNRTQEKSYPREIVPNLNGYDFSGEIIPWVRFLWRYRTQGTISPEISYPIFTILL